MRFVCIILMLATLAGCKPPPPINVSREAVWRQFAHQSIDRVLLAWGPPQAETKLTDGSRLITYRHTTLLDGFSPYENESSCEVTMLAHTPRFRIDNVTMKGDAYECHLLAGGRVGVTHRDAYAGPPAFSYSR